MANNGCQENTDHMYQVLSCYAKTELTDVLEKHNTQ